VFDFVGEMDQQRKIEQVGLTQLNNTKDVTVAAQSSQSRFNLFFRPRGSNVTREHFKLSEHRNRQPSPMRQVSSPILNVNQAKSANNQPISSVTVNNVPNSKSDCPSLEAADSAEPANNRKLCRENRNTRRRHSLYSPIPGQSPTFPTQTRLGMHRQLASSQKQQPVTSPRQLLKRSMSHGNVLITSQLRQKETQTNTNTNVSVNAIAAVNTNTIMNTNTGVNTNTIMNTNTGVNTNATVHTNANVNITANAKVQNNDNVRNRIHVYNPIPIIPETKNNNNVVSPTIKNNNNNLVSTPNNNSSNNNKNDKGIRNNNLRSNNSKISININLNIANNNTANVSTNNTNTNNTHSNSTNNNNNNNVNVVVWVPVMKRTRTVDTMNPSQSGDFANNTVSFSSSSSSSSSSTLASSSTLGTVAENRESGNNNTRENVEPIEKRPKERIKCVQEDEVELSQPLIEFANGQLVTRKQQILWDEQFALELVREEQEAEYRRLQQERQQSQCQPQSTGDSCHDPTPRTVNTAYRWAGLPGRERRRLFPRIDFIPPPSFSPPFRRNETALSSDSQPQPFSQPDAPHLVTPSTSTSGDSTSTSPSSPPLPSPSNPMNVPQNRNRPRAIAMVPPPSPKLQVQSPQQLRPVRPLRPPQQNRPQRNGQNQNHQQRSERQQNPQQRSQQQQNPQQRSQQQPPPSNPQRSDSRNIPRRLPITHWAIDGTVPYELLSRLEAVRIGAKNVHLLPVVTFSKKDRRLSKPTDVLCCPICLDEFIDGDQVKRLPCFHEYHVACIDRWLGMSRYCPICKGIVDKDL
jgi:hypothetical protein